MIKKILTHIILNYICYHWKTTIEKKQSLILVLFNTLSGNIFLQGFWNTEAFASVFQKSWRHVYSLLVLACGS